RDVRTRDQQNQSDRAEQRQQRRTNVAHVRLAERVETHAARVISFWILLFESGRDRVEFGGGLFDGDSRFESRNGLDTRISAARAEAFRGQTDRHCHVGLKTVLETGGRDAGDGKTLAVKRQLAADDRLIAAESSLPKVVAQDNGGCGA